ncbi:unnamed protein product [Arctogadus glacialis]
MRAMKRTAPEKLPLRTGSPKSREGHIHPATRRATRFNRPVGLRALPRPESDAVPGEADPGGRQVMPDSHKGRRAALETPRGSGNQPLASQPRMHISCPLKLAR